jgi:hypothetical protein
MIPFFTIEVLPEPLGPATIHIQGMDHPLGFVTANQVELFRTVRALHFAGCRALPGDSGRERLSVRARPIPDCANRAVRRVLHDAAALIRCHNRDTGLVRSLDSFHCHLTERAGQCASESRRPRLDPAFVFARHGATRRRVYCSPLNDGDRIRIDLPP